MGGLVKDHFHEVADPGASPVLAAVGAAVVTSAVDTAIAAALDGGSISDAIDTAIAAIPALTKAAFVDPSTGTVEDVVNALIDAGLMEAS